MNSFTQILGIKMISSHTSTCHTHILRYICLPWKGKELQKWQTPWSCFVGKENASKTWSTHSFLMEDRQKALLCSIYFFPVKFPVDFRNLHTSYCTINKPYHDHSVVVHKQLYLTTNPKPFHDLSVVVHKQLYLITNPMVKANYSPSNKRVLSFSFWVPQN